MKFYTIFKFFIGRIIFFILSNNKKNKELKIKRNNLKWNIVLNDAIGLSLYLFGSFEKKNISCFSKFLKKNTVVIDIGANIGVFCIPFYAEYSKLISKIYAIEPDYRNFNLLKKNIKNNFFQDKILSRKLLITNNKKFNPIFSHYPLVRKKVSKSIHNFYSKFLFSRSFGPEQGNVKNTKKISFDKIKLRKSENYVLKIDVDGNEFHVIKSAEFFIKTKKPMILLEISKSFLNQKQFNYIINFLHKNNYNLILFNKFKINPKIIEFDLRNFSIDYLFIHRDDY